MDLKDRMAELDARMAARRDALDKKLGLAPVEEQPALRPGRTKLRPPRKDNPPHPPR